jgi:tRNA pseudouridine13 synthase
MADAPHLTRSIQPLTGVFKACWEDFEVTELPRLQPEGRGDHTWMEVEKRGLTTATAAGDLARALGVKRSAVGYAGLKDARSVARQWMSVEHVDPRRALELEIPRIRVLRAERHPRKLRRGWHAGNRFRIKLRPSAPDAPFTAGAALDGADVARACLDVLSRRGVPNYYGAQRFGYRGDTWAVGRSLAREEWSEAAALIAGRPLRAEDPMIDPAAGVHPDRDDLLRARELFDAGHYAEAARAWPRGYAQCSRVAAGMHRTGGDARRAVASVGKGMLRFYAEAYQSWLFNQVVARRIDGIDQVERGDLAWKHDRDALFLVEDPEIDQARADAFHISPTGPLIGTRMREPEGAVARLEGETLRAAGFVPAELASEALRHLAGRRRPLRFEMSEVAVERGRDAAGPFLELGFVLPPGCYATAVLRELGKGHVVERGTPIALRQTPTIKESLS